MSAKSKITAQKTELETVRSAFRELWESLSFYLTNEEIESLRTYHAEAFATLEGTK